MTNNYFFGPSNGTTMELPLRRTLVRSNRYAAGSFKCLLVLLFTSMQSINFAQNTELPNIPGSIYNITDFGAIADGKTINTIAIQTALDKAKNNGGTVIVPQGIFLCGPLNMYGNTNLQIDKDAVLRLRNDVDSFPAEKERYLNFITVSKASDVKISGSGTIDGQGEVWWNRFTNKSITYRRPQMLFIEGSNRIEIEGVTFLNPPNTHVSLKNCKQVYIHHITIQAPEKSRNTDGLNISVKDCLIEHCKINTGDDNIAINFGNKNGNPQEPECKNILIRNCDFGYGHGLSIGSYTSGSLTNLKVQNCNFDGTTSAIRIKTNRERGGTIQDVVYENININNSKWPIFISQYYPKEPKTPEEDTTTRIASFTPFYKNILLSNINISTADDAIKIWGVPESPITNLKFSNVNISSKKGIQLYNAKQVVFDKCKIIVQQGEFSKTFNAAITGL